MIHTALLRFSEEIVRDLVHIEEGRGEDGVGVNTDPLTCVWWDVWGMLYTDDAGLVSKSEEILAKMMIVIVTVIGTADFTVSRMEAETLMLRTPDKAPRTSPLVIKPAGLRYRQHRFVSARFCQCRRRQYTRK